MSQTNDQPAVIEIKASYFFLAFLLSLFKPMASINGGQPFPVRWGVTPVPVPPGRYQVEVWLPYLFLTTMGKNGTIVDLPAGGAVQVAWRSPWLVFLQGKVTVGPAQGGPAQGAPQGMAPGGALPPPPAGAQGMTPGGALPPPPAAAQPAPSGAWHPDPSGRHEQRYHDGSAWTDHVVDQGAQSTDPVGG